MPETRCIATRATYRRSTPADDAAIREIEARSYRAANPVSSEIRLNSADTDTLSLVAEIDGKVIGHILMVAMSGPAGALALAPLAVLPEWREMQIGTELVRHALDLARRQGWQSVFVQGQPDYYGRFGFRSGTADGAVTNLQGARLLALELSEDSLSGWSGELEFPEGFGQLGNPAQSV
ncbi:putative acetyltransferase [Hoeflea halophila]|uniref:Putative acetyltransferase n=1 Tax=Hoeflea halophila TaxID=714899 RepID=A0A286IAX4_9HYPH|nr:N-acetyltransferase [Hoeflea halophila]SOE16776.1 putative acetyltransferase [Hoeflea halophila]